MDRELFLGNDNEGERDFNHVVDAEYVKWRDLAKENYLKCKQKSRESQEAYQNGDGQLAHELSVESKQYRAEAEEYDQKAAEYVFVANNEDSSEDEIDLHGLYVKEAEIFVKKRFKFCIHNNRPYLNVIVGKGLHSKNGIAKLKPSVEEWCREYGISCSVDPDNSGVLVVDLSDTHASDISTQVSHAYNATPQNFHQQQQNAGDSNQNQNQNDQNNSSEVNVFLQILEACFKKLC
ncbi:Smr domain-containing protein [Ascoidea rubescens DSM 1968]|uniref:Smr-domain-containing protein n=1 Tax=Ascoidea rubescens DSM 1968 TaxID=1344418 RepID=A0A1D2VRS6_9ASCO|nr:Smr-domain-containing protein [Ascoidea rubescens DSM 1968]ODV64313.1 Smr-domain-containing protein [Ascoidea rubescens DSM 1968]